MKNYQDIISKIDNFSSTDFLIIEKDIFDLYYHSFENVSIKIIKIHSMKGDEKFMEMEKIMKKIRPFIAYGDFKKYGRLVVLGNEELQEMVKFLSKALFFGVDLESYGKDSMTVYQSADWFNKMYEEKNEED